MEVSVKGGMALHYNKLLELQEKLRERERAHCKKLQFQCRKLIDKDRKRHERNDDIVRSLEEIEMRMGRLTSKTKDLETFRFSNKPLQKYQDLQSSRKNWNEKVPTSNHKGFGGYDDETQIRTMNCDLDKNPKQTVYPHRFKKTPEDLNSLAEYMTNSISSRYYKKDVPESTPYANPSIYSNVKDFEKGMYDEQENQKPNKDLFPYSTDVLKSYDTQIRVNDEMGQLKKNEINGNSLKQRNNMEKEINTRSQNIDQKYHNKPDVYVSVNKADIGNIQNSSETGILKNTNIDHETLNESAGIRNVKNFDQSGNDSEVISHIHLDNKEGQISQVNCKQNISGLNSQIASQSLELPKRHENLEIKKTNDFKDDKNISEEFMKSQITGKNNYSSYSARKEPFGHHDDSQDKQLLYPDDSTQPNQQRSNEEPNQLIKTQYDKPSDESSDDHKHPSEVNYDKHEISEEYPRSQITDKNNQSSYSAGKEPFDCHSDSQDNQMIYPSESTELNQQRSNEESNQPLQSQYENPSVVQYDDHEKPAVYPEMQYDAHVKLDSNKQYDGTEQCDQYPDSSNYLSNSHKLQNEENEKNAIQTDKNEESVLAVESNGQKQVEPNQESKEFHVDENESTETSVLCQKIPNNLLGDQVLANNINETSIRDVNIAEDNRQNQIENSNISEYDHLDNQYEHQTHQFENSGQHQYNDNGQPILQYDENGQLLREYDQNAMYQYDQHYDNSAHNYGEHNEEYQEQYGQYDQSQIYQQTEGMNATGDEAQIYMNQVGQYDEQNPTTQNYQYTGEVNTSGVETGIYMDQDGRYEDQQPSQIYQGSGEINESGGNEYMGQVEQYDQIDQMPSQAYQQPDANVGSGEINESGGNVDEYMGQVEQYDQIDQMPSQAYQQPDANVTGVEENVEQLLQNDASEGGEIKENI